MAPPKPPVGEAWGARLADADTVVAEVDGDLAGFMSLVRERSYLDFALVLPKFRGKGVADSLYAVVERRARALGLRQVTTQASLLAEPFFARQGWNVVERQTVERRGVVLRNCLMEKQFAARKDVA